MLESTTVMHTNKLFITSGPHEILAWGGAVFCLLSTMVAAQPDPYPTSGVKPQAPAAPPLPPLPGVKGTIAKAPDSPDGKVVGLNAKTVLKETLKPRLNLEESWAAGVSGWRAMVLDAKKDSECEKRVAAFIQARVADAWEASNQGNGYKPLRDLIAKRYGFSKAPDFPADQAGNARKLMIDACHAVDANARDGMPDFLYTWWHWAPVSGSP
jgi:hypothetical protein